LEINMSLDITLYKKKPIEKQCHHCGSTYKDNEELYWANITHNLGEMADEAGIYLALWRPEDLNIDTAKALIPILTSGLNRLKNNPDYYKKYNPSNGWGKYENLVSFIKEYLEACNDNPEAIIEISR